MPEGRLIKRKIADNERLNGQPVQARLLYDRLILFVDREARHSANPRLLLRRFFPLDEYTDEQMQEWLEALHNAKKNGVGLLELYQIDGIQYLWLPGFEKEQSKSWSHPTHGTKWKEAESSIPPPPTTKEKRKAIAESDIILTPFEMELLETMKTIPGWDYDEVEDTVWIRSLSEDYTNVTIDNLKACRDFHSSKPEEKKGPWKNRIRNWLKHDQDFRKEAKGGADRKNPRVLPTKYTDPSDL